MSTDKGYRPKRRIMRALKLTEISAVDTPAQEGARMVLMKRHEDAEKAMGLADVFTTAEEGHQHGVQIINHDGEPHLWITYASGPDGEPHSHDVMRDNDGNLVLSVNEGHTHELDAAAVTRALMTSMIGKLEKDVERRSMVSVAAILAGTRDPVPTGKSADDLGNQPLEDNMADKNADTLSADLKKRDEEIALLRAVIDLTPEHRAHYDSLPAAKQESFIGKSHADRNAELEAIEKANPVVYTDSKGREYRKNDDQRLIDMAKERDADHEAMAKFRTESEQAGFEKKATELLGLIPGEQVVKVAVIRAISKVDDEETRNEAFKMLEGANKVYKMAMHTGGVTETVSPANVGVAKASDLLEAAVDACAREDGISKHAAYEKVLSTASGQRLYDAARIERIASGSNRVGN